jgi:hypothetical protein
MKDLTELLDPYQTISIIGMAKNVGKTTTLNYLISNFHQRNIKLALTSIGRDGERVDVVTKTAKPDIFVFRDTLIVTAEKLLYLCDITKEIQMVSDINTPMGRVVVVRALSDGFVQLGGPSITTQIAGLLEHLPADKTIVDGAVSRKTLANPGVTEATILCTGAALSRSLRTVIEETRHTVQMLTLPKMEDSRILAALENVTEETRAIEKGYIYFPGAVSDAAVHGLVTSNAQLKDVCLIAEDPSKIFIKPATYEKLKIKQAKLLVKTPIRLAALTVNPVSPYDIGFDAAELLEKMRENVSVPVFDVCKDEGRRK